MSSAFGRAADRPPDRRAVCISGASAVKAAIRNGVAPALPRTPLPDGPRSARSSHRRRAPRAALTNCRLRQIAGADRRRVAVVAVAAVRLADPSQRVQRCVAGALIVGIGAGFDQGMRQFEMAVLDGQDQRDWCRRRGSLPRRSSWRLHGFVHVGAGLEQRLTTSMRPSRTAKNSGVKPDGKRRAKVGAGGQ